MKALPSVLLLLAVASVVRTGDKEITFSAKAANQGGSMTDAQWLACAEPAKMLDFLRRNVSDRQLRLFACACCRRIWELLPEKARQALEVVEQFADGQVPDSFRSQARKEAQRAAQGRDITTTPDIPKFQCRAASSVYYAAARIA
jgi:hypothetical protein